MEKIDILCDKILFNNFQFNTIKIDKCMCIKEHRPLIKFLNALNYL